MTHDMGKSKIYILYVLLMNNEQHGGRRKKSCLSQLLEHHDKILRMLEENANVDVIYTDFKKAYEKVDHKKLLEKMEKKYGITGKLKNWLTDFLTNRVQKVVIEETLSEETKVVSGAVQGSVMGPIFFLMFIGDIADDITANTKLFVDDAKVKSLINKKKMLNFCKRTLINYSCGKKITK